MPRLNGIVTAANTKPLLQEAARRAHAPVSGYKVGCLAVTKSGFAAFGANFEIENVPLGFTIHAEQTAVANALSQGHFDIERLVVSAPPCGHCRQFLMEFFGPALALEIKGQTAALGAFLPEHFGPKDLGTLPKVSDLAHSDHAGEDRRKHAWAPYSKFPQSAEITFADGAKIYGTSLESAAFNPSLGALPAAMAIANVWGYKENEVASGRLTDARKWDEALFQAYCGKQLEP